MIYGFCYTICKFEFEHSIELFAVFWLSFVTILTCNNLRYLVKTSFDLVSVTVRPD